MFLTPQWCPPRQEQHVGDQGAGREDDWQVRPEEQARGQAQRAAPVPEASLNTF